jgi:hypothetical protein
MYHACDKKLVPVVKRLSYCTIILKPPLALPFSLRCQDET